MLSSFRAILTGPKIDITPDTDAQFGVQVTSARAQFELRNPHKDKAYTYFVETIFTLQDFDQYRFPVSKLESAANKACVNFTGWPFLFFHYNRSDLLSRTEDGLESLISTQDFAGKDMLDFWRFDESGLFYKKELQFNSDSNPPQASAPGIIRHFTEAIFCLTRLYEDLISDSDVVSLCVTLLGSRGRNLVWTEIGFVHGDAYQANRPAIKVQASHTLAEWRAEIEIHSIQLAREVFQSFHLQNPDLERMKTQVRNVLQRRL